MHIFFKKHFLAFLEHLNPFPTDHKLNASELDPYGLPNTIMQSWFYPEKDSGYYQIDKLARARAFAEGGLSLKRRPNSGVFAYTYLLRYDCIL